VSCAAITLCVASRSVFIFVLVYFVTDSVRKRLDTPAYFALLHHKWRVAGRSCEVQFEMLQKTIRLSEGSHENRIQGSWVSSAIFKPDTGQNETYFQL
jgi:hypothetical protein